MTFFKSILLLISLSMLAALVACGSSSSSTPPPITITVTLSSVATSLTVNSQTHITATTNDTAGVTWTVACTTSPCGTLNPASTLTGVATTYTAPAFPTTGVVITATSVTNHAIFASTPTITIAAATLADGTYVFSVTGSDYSDEVPYHVGGAFTISGGLITQGEQDFVDFYEKLGDEINGTGLSTVTTTADGNLQITLVTCLGTDCTQADTLVGVGGTETFNGSVYPLNSAKAAITEYDASATGSGELDTQDSTAFVVGTAPGPASYAFVIGGLDGDAEGGFPFNMGGVINVDGADGAIDGVGSVFDANDDFSSLTYQGQDFANTSFVSAPDAFGRVTFTLDTSVFPEMILAGYIVNSKKIQLVETADTYLATLGGIAYTQTPPVGGFTSTTASGNSYVVGLNGSDTISVLVLQVAGLLTLNADTTISGFINYNDLILPAQAAPSAITGGTWAEDAGTGRVTLSNVTDVNTGPFTLQLYLDGNNHAPTIMLDASAAVGGPGFQQSGGGSFAATSFTGPYAMGATGWNASQVAEFDAVGPVVATGGAGTFAGFSDVNWLLYFPLAPITVTDENVSGTFTAAANGAFTGTITGLDVTSCPAFLGGVACTADTFIYYLVDPTGDNIAIETDGNQITLGYFIQK